MTYKAAKNINANFVLNDQFEPVLAVSGAVIESGMDRGYVFAAMYFFDAVTHEVEKIKKMINKIIEEISMEINIQEPTQLLGELTTRVRKSIGDDSLDAYIKEILADQGTESYMALMPTKAEIDKFERVKESIFLELLDDFYKLTIKNAKETGQFKTFRFAKEYVNTLTERQKRLVQPAMKLVGFMNGMRLDNLEVMQDWSVIFMPSRVGEKFDVMETQIKDRLKTIIMAG